MVLRTVDVEVDIDQVPLRTGMFVVAGCVNGLEAE